MTYNIRYPVTAKTEFEAITRAVELLRTNVTLIRIVSVEPVGTYMWSVLLAVTEETKA